ncbi:MAG TPA: GNAT family N-acetyltransferase, partial [Candidatus Limnocylindria bacterium]|nr:GNAT family N-acetyltransferase [Candidatus Limnocylindria bacterium]
LGDPVLTPRLGLSVVRRAGLVLVSSVKLDAPVFNHTSGYGTFAAPTQRGVDAVLRHDAAIGRRARIEVAIPGVSRSDRALLERSGFRDSATLFQCHIRTTARPPRARDVPGLLAERATARSAGTYARLATAGFGGRHSVIADVFERGWTRQIKGDRRVAAFIGRVRGRPAATGVLVMRPDIAGLYSGSVLPRYRGRGLQNAMIAARLRYGWDRGLRTFYSWSDPDSASARNLRDEGFRTRYEVHMYEREP